MSESDNVNLLDIVREYFPCVSDDEAGYILWNGTGYPSFWKGDPLTSLREQLAGLRDGTLHIDEDFGPEHWQDISGWCK